MPDPQSKDILTEAEYLALKRAGFVASSRRNFALNKGGSVEIVTGGGKIFAVIRLAKLTPETTAEITTLLTDARNRETQNAEALNAVTK